MISIRGGNPVGHKRIILVSHTLNCPLLPLFIVKTDTIMKNKGMSYNSFDDKGKLNGCHYYILDYQGNNYMVVRNMASGKGAITQRTSYYPYGAEIWDMRVRETEQDYKYSGKELDRTYGLDLYDYHARQQDAKLGRFNSIDPLAEKDYGTSPYAYCKGNPVNMVDKDGKDSQYIK